MSDQPAAMAEPLPPLGATTGQGDAGTLSASGRDAVPHAVPPADDVSAHQDAGQMDEHRLLDALRQGDELAFVALVERYHSRLLRQALLYVPNRAIAEEVVQDTWQGVLVGLPRFEGRASLKSWIYRILINSAKSRGPRERRTVPFSSFALDEESGDAEPVVEAERFRDTGPGRGHWISVPADWQAIPEERLLAQETRTLVEQTIETLPSVQRAVITLRDMEQCTSDEVCAALEISEGNQRVLLHRARAPVRRALEQYFSPDTA